MTRTGRRPQGRQQEHEYEELSPLQQAWVNHRNMLDEIPLERIARNFIGIAVQADFSLQDGELVNRYTDRVSLWVITDIPHRHWRHKKRQTVLVRRFPIRADLLTGQIRIRTRPAETFDFRQMPYTSRTLWFRTDADHSVFVNAAAGKTVTHSLNNNYRMFYANGELVCRIRESDMQYVTLEKEGPFQADSRGRFGAATKRISVELAENKPGPSGDAVDSEKRRDLFDLLQTMNEQLTWAAVAKQDSWASYLKNRRDGLDPPVLDEGQIWLGQPYCQMFPDDVQRSILSGAPLSTAFRQDFVDYVGRGCPLYAEATGQFRTMEVEEGKAMAKLSFDVLREEGGITSKEVFTQLMPAKLGTLGPILLIEPGEMVEKGKTVIAYAMNPAACDYPTAKKLLGEYTSWMQIKFLENSSILPGKHSGWSGRHPLYPARYVHNYLPTNETVVYWDIAPLLPRTTERHPDVAILPPIPMVGETYFDGLRFCKWSGSTLDLVPMHPSFSETPLSSEDCQRRKRD